MVHGRACLRVRVRAKRRCDNAADNEISRLPTLAQADARIALVIHKGLQNPRVGLFEAFDPPARTDKILAVVASYRAPFLTR